MTIKLYKVVAAGIANSGKSSVLNALTGKRDIFPVGDVPRITRGIKRYTSGNLLLVDTPGLDADNADTRKQMIEILSADTVLWCHNLRKGELGAVEVDALKQYAKDTQAIWRTCFVLTNGDNLANYKVICETTSAIATQLQQIFNLRFIAVGEKVNGGTEKRPRPFNVVCIERYWRGKMANSGTTNKWQHLSGVPKLRKFLDNLAGKYVHKTFAVDTFENDN